MNPHALLAVGGAGAFGDSPLDITLAWAIVAVVVMAVALVAASSWRATHHHH